MGDGGQDRVHQPDAHERDHAGERDREDGFRLPERARHRATHQRSPIVRPPATGSVRLALAGAPAAAGWARSALTRASMAGRAAASAARSSGLSRSSSPATRSARSARRPASMALPSAVIRTCTTRPSAGSAARSTRPASSSRAITCVIAGCVTPSRPASQVSRDGPDRSRVASVAADVSDNPLAGLSDRNSPISRSSAAATPAASVSSERSRPPSESADRSPRPPETYLSYLYHFLMYLRIQTYIRYALCYRVLSDIMLEARASCFLFRTERGASPRNRPPIPSPMSPARLTPSPMAPDRLSRAAPRGRTMTLRARSRACSR